MLKQTDRSLLEAALIGYEAERQKIQETIAELQRRLNGGRRARTKATVTSSTQTRRPMSAAARKRIAAAQKRRWAEFRRQRKAA